MAQGRLDAMSLSVSWALWVTLSAQAPLCPLPPPGPVRDAKTAQAYAAVAEEERLQGALANARRALSEALKLSPQDKGLQRLWRTLCEQMDEPPAALSSSPSNFDEAMALYQRGDLASAARAFSQVHARFGVPDAILMEGICWYEQHDDVQARRALEIAAADPSTNDSAELFLGLIALRQRDLPSASAHFEAVTLRRDSALRTNAVSLLRQTRQTGRYVFSLLAQAGAVSNVDLLPDGAASTPVSSAGPGLELGGLALMRPWGESGPYARLQASARHDVIPNVGHQGALLAGGGWQWGTLDRHVLGEYAFELIEAGGAAYLLSHRWRVHARWAPNGWGAGLGGLVRTLDYRYPGTEPYGGLRLEPSAELFGRWGRVFLRLEPRYIRNIATLGSLTSDTFGLELWTMVDFTPWRFSVQPLLELRSYDQVDATSSVARRDQALGTALAAEWDLGERWTWEVLFTYRYTWSNVTIQPDRWTLTTGLSFTWGIL